jgi:hypothetical protein
MCYKSFKRTYIEVYQISALADLFKHCLSCRESDHVIQKVIYEGIEIPKRLWLDLDESQ